MSGEPPDSDRGEWKDLSDLQKDGDPALLDVEDFVVEVSVQVLAGS